MGSIWKENWKRGAKKNIVPANDEHDLIRKEDEANLTTDASGIGGVPIIGSASLSGQILKFTGIAWVPSSDVGGFFSEGSNSTAALGNGLVPPTNAGSYSIAHGTSVVIGSNGDNSLALGDNLSLDGKNSLLLGENLSGAGSNTALIGSGITTLNPYNTFAHGVGHTGMSNSAVFGSNNYPGTFSLVGGADNRLITNSRYNLVGGQDVFCTGVAFSLVGGQNNGIKYSYWNIMGGRNNEQLYGGRNIICGESHFLSYVYGGIIGGQNNRAQTFNNGVLFGRDNVLTGGNEYSLLGGQNNNLGYCGRSMWFGQNSIGYNNEMILHGGHANDVYGSFRSVIQGQVITATGVSDSIVVGRNQNISSAVINSAIFGRGNVVNTSNNSLVAGLNNVFTGNSVSMMFGQENSLVNSYYNIVAGKDNTLDNIHNTAVFGGGHSATETNYCLIAGLGNTMPGDWPSYGIMTGQQNYASGTHHAIFGRYNRIDSNFSIAGGYYNKLSTGDNSIVAGKNNINKSRNSQTFGISNKNYHTTDALNKGGNFVAGQDNYCSGDFNAIFGKNNRFDANINYAKYMLVAGNNHTVEAGGYAAWGLVTGFGNQLSYFGQVLLGNTNKAYGSCGYVVALGSSNKFYTDAYYGFTRGRSNTVRREYSSIFGRNNTSSGVYSFVNGYGNTNNSRHSQTFGLSNVNYHESDAINKGSNFVVGQSNYCSGNFNSVFGKNNRIGSPGKPSVATLIAGTNNTAAGYSYYGMLVGDQNTTEYFGQVAIGFRNHSRFGTFYSFMQGADNEIYGSAHGASSNYSIAMGRDNRVRAGSNYGVTIGLECDTSGAYSFAFGGRAHTRQAGQIAFGNATANIGDQHSIITSRLKTTSASSGVLMDISIEEGKAYSLGLRVACRHSITDDKAASFVIDNILVHRDTGSAAKLDGQTTKQKLSVGSASNNNVEVTISGNDAIRINIAGEAGENYNWSGTATFTEVKAT